MFGSSKFGVIGIRCRRDRNIGELEGSAAAQVDNQLFQPCRPGTFQEFSMRGNKLNLGAIDKQKAKPSKAGENEGKVSRSPGFRSHCISLAELVS
jgi:hypothetical protein